MKFIIFSDLHVEDYGGNRLNDCLEVIRTLFKEADTQGADILFAGDLVDKATSLKSHVITALYSVFAECYRDYPEVKFIAISGNHDMTKRYGEQDSSILSLFHEAFANFTHVVRFKQIGDCIIFGCPFYDKREHLEAHLRVLRGIKDAFKTRPFTSILLTHQSDPLTPFADIFADDVKDFDWCFNGHIHKYNQHTERFFTVGNPLWRNASDTGDQKGYLILDTEHKTITRRYLDFPEHSKAVKQVEEGSMYIAPATLSNPELFEEYCKFAQVETGLIDLGKKFM